MAYFNKKLFADLLNKAKGDRSVNEYARQSGISSAHISRLLRALLDTPPSPATIEKLAQYSYGITYEELMEAAGHVNERQIDLLDTLEDKKMEIIAAGQPLTYDQRLVVAKSLNHVIAHNAGKTSSMLQLLEKLDKEGIKNIHIITNRDKKNINLIPILGQIRMGLPIMAEEHYQGELEIPSDIEADFALQARGDSMIGVGLLDGDWAICRETPVAESGEIVVALRDDAGYSEATLKFFFNNEEGPVLRAASPFFKDIPFGEGWRIAGKLIAILRKEAPPYRLYVEYLAARDVNKEKWDSAIERAFQLGIKPEQFISILEVIGQAAKKKK